MATPNAATPPTPLPSGDALLLNPDRAIPILHGFIANEVRKVGMSSVVVNLSGGIDSAVSTVLAARALGPENVLALMLPYETSHPDSLADAEELVEQLGIQSLTITISEQVDPYFSKFPDMTTLRRANKMARERMTILYDHSQAFSGLPLGTSNKTELLLGYGTIFGDMASALNPIGDLYKMQVWQIARDIGVPAKIVDKPPTADLWPGQTDENELGFAYADVDLLLYHMVDQRYSRPELIEAGFDETFVDDVARRVRGSQFKRRLPLIAKLSTRTISTDFRYPRDWGI